MLVSHFWAGCPVHPFNLEIYTFSLGNSFYHYFFKKTLSPLFALLSSFAVSLLGC